MKSIAYYITAHGYGHGTRSCDVLRALNRLYPDVPVIVTTDLPQDFLDSRLGDCTNLTFRKGAFDVGLVQKDSLQIDLDQTLKELELLYAREDELIEQEQRFLEEKAIGIVVTDIPALPLAAAQRAGVPNVAIGNFSWDWIYADYATQEPRWNVFIEKFRAVYGETEFLLRLPFAPPMESFPNRKDIPLLASPGTPQRKQIINSLTHPGLRPPLPGRGTEKIPSSGGVPERRGGFADISLRDTSNPWVLLSFTSLDLDAAALENIRSLSTDYEFSCVQPMAFPGSCIHAVDRRKVCFADTLASCDIVVSKPGFGLVSECIVNKKPLIFTDRGDFAEYPYLVKGIEKYLRNVHLPSAQLYRGELSESLTEIKSAPEPEHQLQSGGAELIAQELMRSGGW